MAGWWEKIRTRRWASRLVLVASLSCLACIVACSGAAPPPLPPPPPTNAAGGFSGGSCGSVGGTPFNATNTPYYGDMYPVGYSGSTGDTISMSLYNLGNPSYDNYLHNIVGSGYVNLPDLSALEPYPSSTQITNFCVSSMSITGGQPTPGVFNSADLSIQLVLQGTVQVPLYSGLSGYPGGFSPGTSSSPMGQELVQLNIGTDANCPAYIYQGRLIGCIDIMVGPPSGGTNDMQYVSQ
jgi:hypothetical protein